MEKLSAHETRVVQTTTDDKPVRVVQFVQRHYHFTAEQDENIQDAIAHIKSRVLGKWNMSDSTALAYLAAEYLAANGTRQILKSVPSHGNKQAEYVQE